MFPEMTDTSSAPANKERQFTTEELADILASAITLDQIIESDNLETERAKYRRLLPTETIFDTETIYRAAAEHGCSRESVEKILAIKYQSAKEHAHMLEEMNVIVSAPILCKTMARAYQTALESTLRATLPLEKIEIRHFYSPYLAESTLHIDRCRTIERTDWKKHIPWIKKNSLHKERLGDITFTAYPGKISTSIDTHDPLFTIACKQTFEKLRAQWKPYEYKFRIRLCYSSQLPYISD
jgi:hypothetical protein